MGNEYQWLGCNEKKIKIRRKVSMTLYNSGKRFNAETAAAKRLRVLSTSSSTLSSNNNIAATTQSNVTACYNNNINNNSDNDNSSSDDNNKAYDFIDGWISLSQQQQR